MNIKINKSITSIMNKQYQKNIDNVLDRQKFKSQVEEQRKEEIKKQVEENLNDTTKGLYSMIEKVEKYKYYIIAGLIVLFILRR
jgi:predicted fused transcriptional regulator/phosphomethylpyrimidine kinase